MESIQGSIKWIVIKRMVVSFYGGQEIAAVNPTPPKPWGFERLVNSELNALNESVAD